MFKEMSETRAARFFTARPNVIGHIHMNKWVGFIFMQNNGQAVIEFILRIWNDDLIPFCGRDCFNLVIPLGRVIDAAFLATLSLALHAVRAMPIAAETSKALGVKVIFIL